MKRGKQGGRESSVDRRQFLGTGAALLGFAVGCSSEDSEAEEAFEPEAVPESMEVFPRTPIAGEMKPTSFLVAGFVASGDAVSLRVWQRAGAVAKLVWDQQVTADARGFLKAQVDGLAGGEWYEYALFSADAAGALSARSLIGKVRTALPDGSKEPVRVAIAACIGRGVIPEYVEPDDPAPVALWDSLAQCAGHDYDVFIHLGDQGYFDRVWEAGGSLEQYLAAWGAYHGGGYRDVYPRTGVYCTWDDHEVTNNSSVDPWTSDPEERARIENALRAYYTVMPIAATEPFVDKLWRSFRWGDTVEFIVLDCRYERQALESGVYLSAEQFAFLKDRLLNSPCQFKCVVNSVPFSNLNLPADAPLANQLVNPEDRWQGYVTQRAELQAFVDEHAIDNVLWITGDVHMCFVGQVDRNPTTRGQAMWEVCVTSGNLNPLANRIPKDQFPWASEDAHLPLLTFDPESNTVRLEFIATDGSVAHSRELSLGFSA